MIFAGSRNIDPPMLHPEDSARRCSQRQRTCGTEDRLTGRQAGQQRMGTIRVQFGEDIVEQQDRRGAAPTRHDIVGAKPEGQRKGPLLTLGCVGA